jgi:hypothetical protein
MKVTWLAACASLLALGTVALEQRARVAAREGAEAAATLHELRTQAALADNVALSVRSNLMGNYDPVVSAVDTLRRSMAELERALPQDDDLQSLRGAIDARTALVEKLKAEWAKQRNSSKFLLTWLGNPGEQADPELAALLSAWLVDQAGARGREQLRAHLEKAPGSTIATHVNHVIESHRLLVEATSLLLERPLAPIAASVSARLDARRQQAAARWARARLGLACLTLLAALGTLWTAIRHDD